MLVRLLVSLPQDEDVIFDSWLNTRFMKVLKFLKRDKLVRMETSPGVEYMRSKVTYGFSEH